MASIPPMYLTFLLLLPSAWFLHSGLYGLIAKRPLIRAAAWGRTNILWLFTCSVVNHLFSPALYFESPGWWVFDTALLAFLIVATIIEHRWFPSYVVLGVTNLSLRMAVDAALDKLELGVEERPPAIHIPSEQLDLLISRQVAGYATIRVKPASGRQRLRQIVAQTAKSFEGSPVEMNNTVLVANIVLGLVALGSGIYFGYRAFFS